MKKELLAKLCILVGGGILSGCLEPFSAPEIDQAKAYLVVDGFLNTSLADTSYVKLSLTQRVNDLDLPTVVKGAKVEIESKKGNQYAFSEFESGHYRLLPRVYDPNDTYRLKIVTLDNKIFTSDYEPVTTSPPIDSIYYNYNGKDGIFMYVDTHDPKNKTHFYRWDYDETWVYRAPISSDWEKVVTGHDASGAPIYDLVTRQIPVHTCYSTHDVSNLVIGTSIKLSQDIIKGARLGYVPASSGKLISKYSVNVRQYGLTQKEYKYWAEIAKTTELNGGLFDPLPSLVTGNIRSESDPEESVFGYFSVTHPATKRVFFTPYLGTYGFCMIEDTLPKDSAILYPGLVVSFVEELGKYLVTSVFCGDCRAKGGVLEKPPYWF